MMVMTAAVHATPERSAMHAAAMEATVETVPAVETVSTMKSAMKAMPAVPSTAVPSTRVPSVPSEGAAPTEATTPSIAAPIPTRPVPSGRIPTVVPATEDELRLFDRRRNRGCRAKRILCEKGRGGCRRNNSARQQNADRSIGEDSHVCSPWESPVGCGR
jgi:hypothetical protein